MMNPRREDYVAGRPGLASINDDGVLWLFDQLAAEKAARASDAEVFRGQLGYAVQNGCAATLQDGTLPENVLAKSLKQYWDDEKAARERAEARVRELELKYVSGACPQCCADAGTKRHRRCGLGQCGCHCMAMNPKEAADADAANRADQKEESR